MTRRIRMLLVVAVLLLLGLAGWYQFAGQRVPAGQVPLTALTAASLDPLKDEFNRSSDQVRVLLLLSPT
jgi:hypothetical protein